PHSYFVTSLSFIIALFFVLSFSSKFSASVGCVEVNHEVKQYRRVFKINS
ncbi:hypothetical protein KSS87_023873, partial [Heliosperma pusillum]